MAEEEFAVVSKSPYAWVNAERKLVQSTFVVYRLKGAVGTIVVRKADPTDAEIHAAIEKRAAAK